MDEDEILHQLILLQRRAQNRARVRELLSHRTPKVRPTTTYVRRVRALTRRY